jgi:hypothetical protein
MTVKLTLIAMAALALAGCSSSTGATAVQPTRAATPTSTVTVTAAPPVTVTVSPPPTTAAAQPVANGPASFASPSGNINCSLSTPGGQTQARCEVVDHTWQAQSGPPDCHQNWGSRLYLTQGGDATLGCYGQDFPPVSETLDYGQSRSFGTLTCDSETTGITCTDTSTGHYFRAARDSYELG